MGHGPPGPQRLKLAGIHSTQHFGGNLAYLTVNAGRQRRNQPTLPQVIECVYREKKSLEMVGRQYDCLVNPLGAVRFTFEKAVTSGTDPASLDRNDWGVADLFREFLFDNDGISQVLYMFIDF